MVSQHSVVACVLSLRSKYLQIARVIIPLVSIDVMDDFSWKKRSPKNLLCNNPVGMPAEGFSVSSTLA